MESRPTFIAGSRPIGEAIKSPNQKDRQSEQSSGLILLAYSIFRRFFSLRSIAQTSRNNIASVFANKAFKMYSIVVVSKCF